MTYDRIVLLISSVLNREIDSAQFQSYQAANGKHNGCIDLRIQAKAMGDPKDFHLPNHPLNKFTQASLISQARSSHRSKFPAEGEY